MPAEFNILDDNLPFFAEDAMPIYRTDRVEDCLPFFLDFANALETQAAEMPLVSNDALDAIISVPISQPQLPVEILIKIISMAHYENESSIAPLMRVSKTFNMIAESLLYETIPLNMDTLSKLPACILAKPNENPVLQASHDRKINALSRITKLVVEKNPVLLLKLFDRDLVKFCRKVILPNVTMVEWRQTEIDEYRPRDWAFDQAYDADPLLSALPHFRADIFRRVLPATNKTMCIRIPKCGYFHNTGVPANATGVIEPAPLDRMMEYMNAMSGRVELRIHENLTVGCMTLPSLPTIYHFRSSFTGRHYRFSKTPIFDAYIFSAERHLRLLLRKNQRIVTKEYLENLGTLLLEGKGREEQATAAKKAVNTWLPSLKLGRGVSQKDVCAVILRDFFQAAAAMRNEGATDSCPCCGDTGVEF